MQIWVVNPKIMEMVQLQTALEPDIVQKPKYTDTQCRQESQGTEGPQDKTPKNGGLFRPDELCIAAEVISENMASPSDRLTMLVPPDKSNH